MLVDGTYDGQVVVVTGGGTGLGKAIAIEFARLGAAVGIASRSAEHRETGVTAVESVGTKAVGVELDVREPESVAAAFDAVEAALGPVTTLINNAAANFPVPAAELSPNGWRAVERIVLDGTFFCSQEFHRRITTRQATGSILNIAATQAATGGPGMAHSAAAKAGVVSLTKSLAVEWAPDGIRVNAIAPGLFPHEDLPEAIRAARDESLDASRQPAGRVGQPHELGWAATWLCSPYASFVTGHVLVIDGGNWLRRDFAMPPFRPITEQLGR
ncbi:MAG TPA: SDR family oxidoreductase [Mycobacteriales bacterium]|jgi:NAD(P)-dependent dehydrogenase (short-subunit alcohol dehydrogenase family)|nr:SDR family oxidoreductase [Mycobacteriales bacterium]